MSSIDSATVVKFNLYPRTDPTGYAVGFNVHVVGGERFYIDTVVSLEDAKDLSSNQIADLAWAEIRSQAVTRADELADFTSVVGRVVESRQGFGEYFPWVQPGGAGDEYGHEDRVTHNGYVWESNIDGNVWEPGVYGWSIVGVVAEEDATPSDDGATPNEDFPAWQEWDGDNANLHQIDDIVSHNGQNWIATVGDNHWEPGEFGWEIYDG